MGKFWISSKEIGIDKMHRQQQHTFHLHPQFTIEAIILICVAYDDGKHLWRKCQLKCIANQTQNAIDSFHLTGNCIKALPIVNPLRIREG